MSTAVTGNGKIVSDFYARVQEVITGKAIPSGM
jgi:hypothetical protein